MFISYGSVCFFDSQIAISRLAKVERSHRRILISVKISSFFFLLEMDQAGQQSGFSVYFRDLSSYDFRIIFCEYKSKIETLNAFRIY